MSTPTKHTSTHATPTKPANSTVNPLVPTPGARHKNRKSTGDLLDLAWRAHDAAAASIGKADAKAGFVATLDTAIVAGVTTLTNLRDLSGAAYAAACAGLALIIVAVCAAVAVVLPILRARSTRRHAPGSWLYFGAVRHHTADDLADRLAGEDTVRAVCAQTITLARLAWLKHRLLQLALLSTVAGLMLLGPVLARGGA
jgi:hypothetical protein